MAVTLAEAVKRIQQTLLAGVGEAVVTADQFTSALPVELTSAQRVDWNEENSLGSAEVIAAGGAISEAATTTNLSAVYLERFIREVNIPNTVSAADGAFQLAEAAKALGQKLGDQVIDGTGNHSTPEMYGLETYIDSTQTVTVGGALTFNALDAIAYKVLAGSNNMAFVMNKELLTKFNALMRSSGGTQMVEVAGGLLKVPSFNGVPVLRSDYIDNNEGTGTQSSVYCVSLDPAYTKLYMKADTVGSNPYDSMIEVIGPFQKAGYDSQSWRMGFQAALIIKSPLALARAETVTTS